MCFNSLISVILPPQVQLRSFNNSTVIPAKQNCNLIPKQLMPSFNGKGAAPQAKPFSYISKPHGKPNSQYSQAFDSCGNESLISAKQAVLVPAIKISFPSPHEDWKERPIFLNTETRLGFPDRRKRNENITSFKGSRSHGCSPERQTRLEFRCVSSPHIPEQERFLLPTDKIKLNFPEHEGRRYLSSYLCPRVIAPSRSVPSLTDTSTTRDNLDLSASSPACLLRSAKVQANQCHASLKCALEHPSKNYQAKMERKFITQNMEQLYVPTSHHSSQHSQLNVPILEPLSSTSRSASLNALSISSSSELIQSFKACQANFPAGVSSQVPLGSFSNSSNCSSRLSPPGSHAKKAVGLHVNDYNAMSLSTPDLRDAGRHHLKPQLVGEFKYI